jgi:hypothetical protein
MLSTPCGEASYRLVAHDWRNAEPARSKEPSPMAKTEWERGGGSVYDGFCSGWEPSSSLGKTVDFRGQELSPRRSLYLERNVELRYRPVYNDGKCDTTCKEAMHIFKASFDKTWKQEEGKSSNGSLIANASLANMLPPSGRIIYGEVGLLQDQMRLLLLPYSRWKGRPSYAQCQMPWPSSNGLPAEHSMGDTR